MFLRWLGLALGLGASLAALTSVAHAATYYVAPTGDGQECTRVAPCALNLAAEVAVAGDTVVLMDGVYNQGLAPQNSGTPDAWITFQADECALPILEGEGESAVPDADGNVPSGVWSSTGSYLRFVGIVSRYWDSGFANGWTGDIADNSNGHWEIINCIGDGNGRTGMGMYSASGFTVRESIAAHNGGNPTGSWSSGIQLFSVYGTPDDNSIERNVSFENYDAEKNNDGSGFIVDQETQGASFINNIGFRNGGSCMRLTLSHNTRMSHFSCFHNAQNPLANSPTDPGEFYWTDQGSRDTTTLSNTIAAASGSETDAEALVFPPESGLSNNLTLDSGATPFFTDPEGVNPDFRPPSTASAQVENLGAAGVAGAEVDIGFDPKCIIKESPNAPYQQEWWNYSVDYDYIRSIGGVAQCFHPKPRTGGADLGAYELSGEPHAFSEPGGCVPDENRDPGTAVGITATTTTTTTTTTTATATATTTGAGGTSATTGTGDASTTASATTSAMGGASNAAATTVMSSTGAPGIGGNTGAAPTESDASSEGGCGCRMHSAGSGRGPSAGSALVLLLAGLLARRRR